MSVRPLDLQVNFLREQDAKGLRVRDEIHEEGQQRIAAELVREQEEENSNVNSVDRADLKQIREENPEEKRKREEEERKRKKKEEETSEAEKPLADPARGHIIDIKLE